MQQSDLLEAHGGRLREAGEALHEARAALLGERFDGYVADTYHVRGVGYVCWPAVTDGRFDAYDELCAAERRTLEPLTEAGFQPVAVGVSRVVVRPPDADVVVKLARCGTGHLGEGRRANLVEAGLSAGAGPDAPVVPARHCEPRGTFGTYPHVEQRGPGVAEGDAPFGGVPAIREWLADRAPWLDVEEAVAPENRCVWRDRLRTLDYSFPDHGGAVLGVPDHVDDERVVAAVDDRRAAGAKRDLQDGGGFVEEAGG